VKPGHFDAAFAARNPYHLVITLCAPFFFGLTTRDDYKLHEANDLLMTQSKSREANAEKTEIYDFIFFRASSKNYKNQRFFIFRDDF